MYRIRLTDGTEFPTRFASARDGLLTSCIISDVDIADVAATFKGNTQTVTFIYDSSQEAYTGYDKLVLIDGTRAGEYTIALRKEA